MCFASEFVLLIAHPITHDAQEPAKVAGMYTVLCDTDTDGIKQVETLLGLPLANFAWSRDVYAKVLWTSNKDCLHQDEQ
jgi:hypothetical protein